MGNNWEERLIEVWESPDSNYGDHENDLQQRVIKFIASLLLSERAAAELRGIDKMVNGESFREARADERQKTIAEIREMIEKGIGLQEIAFKEFFFSPPQGKDGHKLSELEKNELSSAAQSWNDAAKEIETQKQIIFSRLTPEPKEPGEGKVKCNGISCWPWGCDVHPSKEKFSALPSEAVSEKKPVKLCLHCQEDIWVENDVEKGHHRSCIDYGITYQLPF